MGHQSKHTIGQKGEGESHEQNEIKTLREEGYDGEKKTTKELLLLDNLY
jgi:hypothetical protein